MSGVAVNCMLSVPVKAFAFGVQACFAAPVAGSPALVSTEQDIGPAVFNVAVYLAPVNDVPMHPVRVPLIFIVCTAAMSVSPGESVTVPVLRVHILFATVLAD
jgi:hypothetical protein